MDGEVEGPGNTYRPGVLKLKGGTQINEREIWEGRGTERVTLPPPPRSLYIILLHNLSSTRACKGRSILVSFITLEHFIVALSNFYVTLAFLPKLN